MRKLILAGVLAISITILLTSGNGLAQQAQTISELEISLWPEYDRMATLVIYKTRLSQDTPLPAGVRLPIPISVGDPHVVAAWYPDGRLDDQVSWTRETEGEWSYITVETPTTGVWLEFYDALEISQDDRSYAFRLPDGLQVEKLSYNVRHPVGGREIVVDPVGEISVSPDGSIHTTADLGESDGVSSVEIGITYQNPASMALEPTALPADITEFVSLEFSLLPEFDRPAMLVIYNGRLPAGVPVPSLVRLPIPAAFGEPSAVAVQAPDGRLLTASYESEIIGDWQVITMEADEAAIWVEVYADLVMEGDSRSFSLQWPAETRVGTLGFAVQQPFGAESMQVSPSSTSSVGADGAIYYQGALGPTSRTFPVMVSLAYEKTSEGLTQPSLARPAGTQGSTPDPRQWLPYLLLGVGVGVIVLGLVLYLRSRRGSAAKPKATRRRQRKRRSATDDSEGLEASPVFCHICGTRSAASDRFCRQCGTQLRK